MDVIVKLLASAAGLVARLAVRYGLGLAGSVCLVVGASLVYPPAAWIVAGLLLLTLDWTVAP